MKIIELIKNNPGKTALALVILGFIFALTGIAVESDVLTVVGGIFICVGRKVPPEPRSCYLLDFAKIIIVSSLYLFVHIISFLSHLMK